jgi:hypothetical protein
VPPLCRANGPVAECQLDPTGLSPDRPPVAAPKALANLSADEVNLVGRRVPLRHWRKAWTSRRDEVGVVLRHQGNQTDRDAAEVYQRPSELVDIADDIVGGLALVARIAITGGTPPPTHHRGTVGTSRLWI